jgi:transposase, IS6 family
VKVKKEWMYLYLVVDSAGKTLDFLLSATRDAQAAQRFSPKRWPHLILFLLA